MSTVSAGALRLLPLGGLGEIGMNCLAVEHREGILVVDCGAGFPQDDWGIDVLHPDFSWLTERAERVVGVFLTHGHEDHIGGLPFLLEELKVPVWGPPHALGLAQRRLVDHGLALHELDFRPVHAGQRCQLGPFEVEPVRMSHSIVEATALCLRTDVGTVVHSGDFNFDPEPPDGEPTDEARLRQIGEEGVLALLSDSTNSDVPQSRGSEAEVARTLERLVLGAEQRVVVSLFASNVQRLISLGHIARASGRKLCLLGRSLGVNVELAAQIDRLHWPSDLLVAPEQVAELPRERTLVLAGGTQAERNSALRRLASGEHQHLKLEAGDTVVLSSRVIPGNERAVHELYCDLLRLDLRVFTRREEPGVHTSGHATRQEQQRLIELLRPRYLLPVHGTLHHLRRHAELGRALGVQVPCVVECGTAVELSASGLREGERFQWGKVPIAIGGERLEGETLKRRAELGRAGIVHVALVLDALGRLLAPPAVGAVGVPRLDVDEAARRGLEREAARAVERARHRGQLPAEEVRRALRRVVLQLTGSRPSIEVQVVEVPR